MNDRVVRAETKPNQHHLKFSTFMVHRCKKLGYIYRPSSGFFWKLMFYTVCINDLYFKEINVKLPRGQDLVYSPKADACKY